MQYDHTTKVDIMSAGFCCHFLHAYGILLWFCIKTLLRQTTKRLTPGSGTDVSPPPAPAVQRHTFPWLLEARESAQDGEMKSINPEITQETRKVPHPPTHTHKNTQFRNRKQFSVGISPFFIIVRYRIKSPSLKILCTSRLSLWYTRTIVSSVQFTLT